MGRPREFDLEKAIDAATDLFWKKGYEGTSLNDLKSAMRITAPSFYFAFGSKEKLFRQVIGRYYAKQSDLIEAAFREPTIVAVAEKFLFGFANVLTDPSHAPGCLGLNSALPCEEGDKLRAGLAKRRAELTVQLRERFDTCDKNELPVNADPESLARFVSVMAWGMAVEIQSGANREDLRRTIATALAPWPRLRDTKVTP